MAWPEQRRRILLYWEALKEFSSGVLGSIVGATLLYAAISLLHKIAFLQNYAAAINILQFGLPALLLALALAAGFREFRKNWKAARANQRVAEAFDTVLNQNPPGTSVADISTAAVAEHLKGLKIGGAQLGRLVEQQKQKALVSNEYFREELSWLFVRFLQPLPRNAKRLLNRLRVNQIIAYRRGLFNTEPRVTTQHMGKWLVLMERWPQLGRALAAAPEKMDLLEKLSDSPAPPAPPPGLQIADPFMDSIKELTPFYVGDEDLREFLHSTPHLGPVVVRLAHFGGDPIVAESAVPAA